MRLHRALELVLAVLFAASAAAAENGPAATQAQPPLDLNRVASDDRAPLTITLYFENDGGLLKRNHPTDRHYTNGTAVSVAHEPEWARQFADLLSLDAPAQQGGPWRYGAGYMAGQLMFTPRNIEQRTLIEDDRPYAGYLFAGVYWQRSNDLLLDHLQLDVGVVGPASQADDIQAAVHDVFGAKDPRGWDNQLGDEITAQLYARRKWRLPLLGDRDSDAASSGSGGWQVQLVPQVGVALGTVQRHFEVGTMVRLGWNMVDDFGAPRLADPAAATATPPEGFGFELFARGGGRVVEHNLFLEGNTFRDRHSVDPELVVSEAHFGVRLHYRGERAAVELTYSQTFMTTEFEGQGGGDEHASLILAGTLWF